MLGHKLVVPPKAFRPRRDVDLFLDRENVSFGHGWLQGVEMLGQMFERDAQIHGEPHRHTQKYGLLYAMLEDFRDWLGESKYISGLKTIPPSRFTSSNSNGLWEYSPFLCGVGLMEALEIAYTFGMWMFDSCKEPVLLVHLHNMLHKKGYIKQPIGLYESLSELFPTSFFSGGNAPRLGFAPAFLARIKEVTSRGNTAKVVSGRGKALQGKDIHSMMSSKVNTMFQEKSNLLLYRQAIWNPDRIPDSALDCHTMLAALRLSHTPITVDSTAVKHVEHTELVKRAMTRGMDEETLIQLAEGLINIHKATQVSAAEHFASLQAAQPGYRHSLSGVS